MGFLARFLSVSRLSSVVRFSLWVQETWVRFPEAAFFLELFFFFGFFFFMNVFEQWEDEEEPKEYQNAQIELQ